MALRIRDHVSLRDYYIRNARLEVNTVLTLHLESSRPRLPFAKTPTPLQARTVEELKNQVMAMCPFWLIFSILRWVSI